MGMVKIICVVLCAVSVIGVVRNEVILHTALTSDASAVHGILGMSASLALSIFWACALYGIYRKAPIVWKLGWLVIISACLIFVVGASQAIFKEQQPTDRWIQLLFVVIASSAIGGYWCYFWSRQRAYFLPPRTSSDFAG